MMEAIFSFLSDHYPTIGMMIVVGVVVCVGTLYYVSIQRTKKKVENLPCDLHTEKLNSNTDILNMHTEKLDNIAETLSAICRAMINKRIIDPVSLLKKFSPYSLTEAGEKFLVISGGKKCVDVNLDFFLSELERTKPQTAYDVEEKSRSVIFQHTNSPIFKEIKDYVYLAPEIEKIDGAEIYVSLMTVISAMGIYLRDKYLDIHPELLPIETAIN